MRAWTGGSKWQSYLKKLFFSRNSQVSSEEGKTDGVEENYTHLSLVCTKRVYKYTVRSGMPTDTLGMLKKKVGLLDWAGL